MAGDLVPNRRHQATAPCPRSFDPIENHSGSPSIGQQDLLQAMPQSRSGPGPVDVWPQQPFEHSPLGLRVFRSAADGQR